MIESFRPTVHRSVSNRSAGSSARTARNAKRRLEETTEPPALPASTTFFHALEGNNEHISGGCQVGQCDVVSVLQQVGDDRIARLGDLDVLSTVRVRISAEHKGLVNLC